MKHYMKTTEQLCFNQRRERQRELENSKKKSKSSTSAPATNNIYAMEKFQSEAFQKNRQYIEIGSVYLNFNAFKRFDLLFFSFSIGQVILSGVMIGIGSSNDR